jgi:TatD DNase family protein
MMVAGIDRRTSRAALEMAASTTRVKAFIGIHPSEALKERSLAWVRQALGDASGLGEVGLDPKYSSVGPRSAQMKAYLGQLEEAAKAGKPAQVHSRGAENECLDGLLSVGLRKVLMHWFQSEETLPRVLDSGYFVSFGPSLIYSKRLARMATSCDPGQVLTETDFPVGYEPLRNAKGPHLVPSVVFRLAELWGMSFEDARTATCRNALRFLGSFKKG